MFDIASPTSLLTSEGLVTERNSVQIMNGTVTVAVLVMGEKSMGI
jgi:hypothetical protein